MDAKEATFGDDGSILTGECDVEYLAAALAVTLTTIASLILIWFLDRFEKDPVWLLATVFLWGAVPAVIVSLVVELIFGLPLPYLLDSWAAGIFMSSVVAPVVEESAKGVALLFVFLVLRHHLDDILDGIIYGAVIGVGFAWVEDIFYLFGAAAQGGMEAMGFVFVLRVFVFGLNHAFFTALTGLGFGIAKVVRSCWLGGLAVVFFFAAAVGAHFLHNTLVAVGGEAGIVASFLVHWGGLFALLVVVVVVWFTEWYWIKKELRAEVASGTIGERDYHQVSKWFGRLGWELRFLAALDLGGYFRVRRMYNRLVKLAFLKRSYARRPKDSTERRIAELRERVARDRA
jgi:RsiW-degrading membrane proteinase PrsW (M82 family)